MSKKTKSNDPSNSNVTELFERDRAREALDRPRKTKTPEGPRPRYCENGLTHKQNLFCELVSEGNTLSDSYRGAYDADKMKNSAIWSAASELMSNTLVAQQIRDLLAVKESEHLHDAARLRRFVLENLHAIAADPDNAPSARVSASVAIGKVDVVSMFREIKDVPTENRTADQLKKEIEEKLTRFLAQTIED